MEKDVLENLEKRLVSIDTETTGLRAIKDKIWSLGISDFNGNGIELFSDPRDISEQSENLDSFFLRKTGKFAEEQIKRGSYLPLYEAIKNNKTIPEYSLVQEGLDRLQNKIILIQNANFENKMISGVLEKNNDPNSYRKLFRYNNDESKSIHQKLYTPPDITNLRYSIKNTIDNNYDIKKINTKYKEVLSKYYEEWKSNDGKSSVVELMDITRATLANAEEKGLIPKNYHDNNASVSFLSKLLLKEEESHTALSDSKQQVEIFKKLLGINQEIDSGTISNETTLFFENYTKESREEIKKTFGKELTNIKKEIDEIGKTKLIIPNTIKSRKITISSDQQTHSVFVPMYDTAPETNDIDTAIEFMINKYNKKLNKNEISETVNSFYDNENINKTNIQKIIDSLQDKTLRSSNERSITNKVKDLYINSSLNTKKVMKGSAAIGLGYIVGQTLLNEDKSKTKKIIKEEPKKKEIKNVFDLYNDKRFKIKDNSEINRHNYQ